MLWSCRVERPRAQLEVLARIGGLAGLYKIDLDPLYKPLSMLGGELASDAMVTVPHTFDRIAVTTRATRDRVAPIIDPAQLRRLDRLVPDAGEVEIEIESAGDNFATTVRALGTRPLDTLCAELEALGAGTVGLDRLRRASERLGREPSAIADSRNADGALRWTLQFRHDNDSEEARAATRARLLEVADELAVTVPQKSIIEGLHDVLAKQADSYALVSLAAEHTTPALAIRWQRVRWATVIRMMLGFYPKVDAGTRLGELAGAINVEHAAVLELQLGATEPPAMRIAVTL
jgi:hypothetical protein